MKKKIIIGVLIAVLFVAGIAVNIIARISKKQDIDTPIIQNTIDVTPETDELELRGDKYNSEEGIDSVGNKITAISEAGRGMIVLYWNAKEESSMEAVKILQSYYADYNEKVTFMLVVAMDNEEEDKEPAENFLAENNIEIPVMYETIMDSTSTANEINNIPTLLVINKRGEKINSLIDHITADVIEANLDIITENF